jgi:regulator of protease activity HflC (stomatin/prohibitin superfamily)
LNLSKFILSCKQAATLDVSAVSAEDLIGAGAQAHAHEELSAEEVEARLAAEAEAMAEAMSRAEAERAEQAEQEALENLQALLHDAYAEREQLTLINNNLQRKVISFKERDKRKKVEFSS